jgi:hypothetical protein
LGSVRRIAMNPEDFVEIEGVHWIATNGGYGVSYPDYIAVSRTRAGAIETELDLFPDITIDEEDSLVANGYVNIAKDRVSLMGTQVIRVTRCTCPSPCEHDEEMTEAMWFGEDE